MLMTLFYLLLIILLSIVIFFAAKMGWSHRNDDHNRKLMEHGINPKTGRPYSHADISDSDLREAYERGRKDQQDDDDVKW